MFNLEYDKKGISKEALKLIEDLLVIDPEYRLNSAQMIKSHEYFKDVNWNKTLNRKVKVPYVPKTNGEMDLSYFEDVIHNN